MSCLYRIWALHVTSLLHHTSYKTGKQVISYKDLQAVVATTADTSVTVLHPVTIASIKVDSNTQVTITTSAGQPRKTPDKGKAKPLGKMKKNVAKTTGIK